MMSEQWPVKILGEVVLDMKDGGTPRRSNLDNFGGDINWCVVKDIKPEIFDSKEKLSQQGLDGSSAKLWPAGSIIISLGATIGNIGIARVPTATKQGLSGIVVNQELVQTEFLVYVLQFKMKEIESMATGTTIKEVRPKKLMAELHIPVPPLDEQGRIVNILDGVFENIENSTSQTNIILNDIRDLFQSSLDDAFAEDDNWTQTSLEEILEVQPRNGWSPPAAHHSDSGTPVLTLSSVTGNVFRADQYKFTSAPVDPERHYWVKNGDFLITRSNTPKLVGHVAIASDIITPTIYSDLIMRMKPDNRRVLTKFLYFQMRTTSLRGEITSRAKGANPTMVKINKGSVQSLPISFPPSLDKQQTIVDNVEQLSQHINKLEFIYQQKLSQLSELSQSVLQEAFSGKLTGGITT